MVSSHWLKRRQIIYLFVLERDLDNGTTSAESRLIKDIDKTLFFNCVNGNKQPGEIFVSKSSLPFTPFLRQCVKRCNKRDLHRAASNKTMVPRKRNMIHVLWFVTDQASQMML
jgi:endogenous inhibitor of DNA gyrase (YacG/DUF329 family)